MKYEDSELGVSFTLPDVVPVRQQLLFRGEISGARTGPDMFIRYWNAAAGLVQDWQCELIPDPKEFDMDAESSFQIANIVVYTGNVTASHMFTLSETPKN